MASRAAAETRTASAATAEATAAASTAAEMRAPSSAAAAAWPCKADGTTDRQDQGRTQR
jgi:hypothetical protein